MPKKQPISKAMWIVVTISAIVALIATISIVVSINRSLALTEPDPTVEVLRDDTRILDVGADGAVTVVEFLDFECEACGALYPFVQDLRQRYDDRITFAVRYFPIPSHRNSENAAIAVEAAARQEQFEAMYSKMFETQTQWGELQESQADLFRDYAEEIGLDLEAYDAAVADPATRERVQSDFEDGITLGVNSTPTFFVNGEKVELTSKRDLLDAIDAALEE